MGKMVVELIKLRNIQMRIYVHSFPFSDFHQFCFFQVGFGDLMPRRDQYMYFILLYIILGIVSELNAFGRR